MTSGETRGQGSGPRGVALGLEGRAALGELFGGPGADAQLPFPFEKTLRNGDFEGLK